MTRKFKALALGLFAALAVSAVAVSGVSANINAHTGGHFSNDASNGHAIIEGFEEGNHEIALDAFGSIVECTDDEYVGTMTKSPETQITITPTYHDCYEGTHDGTPNATVTMNGCAYIFKIRDTKVGELHSPVKLECPGTNKAEVHVHGLCTITFGEQEITNAVTYTTITNPINGKHEVTMNVTAHGIKYEKHGLCVFTSPTGTGPHTGASLTGSVTVAGFDTEGNQVNVTATGTDGTQV